MQVAAYQYGSVLRPIDNVENASKSHDRGVTVEAWIPYNIPSIGGLTVVILRCCANSAVPRPSPATRFIRRLTRIRSELGIPSGSNWATRHLQLRRAILVGQVLDNELR